MQIAHKYDVVPLDCILFSIWNSNYTTFNKKNRLMKIYLKAGFANTSSFQVSVRRSIYADTGPCAHVLCWLISDWSLWLLPRARD